MFIPPTWSLLVIRNHCCITSCKFTRKWSYPCTSINFTRASADAVQVLSSKQLIRVTVISSPNGTFCFGFPAIQAIWLQVIAHWDRVKCTDFAMRGWSLVSWSCCCCCIWTSRKRLWLSTRALYGWCCGKLKLCKFIVHGWIRVHSFQKNCIIFQVSK